MLKQLVSLLSLLFSFLSMVSLKSTPWMCLPYMQIHLFNTRQNDNTSKTGTNWEFLKVEEIHFEANIIAQNYYRSCLHDLECENFLTGPRENVVPSATNSLHLSPSAYFCSIVLQAARRCLAISTPVTDPESPRRSAIMQSLAPDNQECITNKLHKHCIR